jgi:ADP-ribose pyrophosphatase YjhB (NUDIX family)
MHKIRFFFITSLFGISISLPFIESWGVRGAGTLPVALDMQTQKRYVLLGRETRGHNQGKLYKAYSDFGGKIDKGEAPLQAAIREAGEETAGHLKITNHNRQLGHVGNRNYSCFLFEVPFDQNLPQVIKANTKGKKHVEKDIWGWMEWGEFLNVVKNNLPIQQSGNFLKSGQSSDRLWGWSRDVLIKICHNIANLQNPIGMPLPKTQTKQVPKAKIQPTPKVNILKKPVVQSKSLVMPKSNILAKAKVIVPQIQKPKKALVAQKKISIAKTVVVPKKLAIVKKPVVVKNPLVVKKQVLTKKPIVAKKLIMVKKSVAAKKSVVVQKPVLIKKPIMAKNPVPLKKGLPVKKTIVFKKPLPVKKKILFK